MRALLKQMGLWAPLSGIKSKKFDDETEEKAYSTILLCLADEVLLEVADEETAVGLWLKLESLYMTQSLTNRVLQKTRFFSLRMKEGTPLQTHFDTFNSYLLDLKSVDAGISDEDAAVHLLVSLPPSYDSFKDSLTSNRETITLEEVRSALHTRELRNQAGDIGSEKEKDEGFGLAVSKSYRGRGQLEKSGTGSRPYLDKDECAFCHEKGHWKRNCPKLKPRAAVVHTDCETVDTKEVDDLGGDDFVLSVGERSRSKDDWILDSGCSSHMCPIREWFSTYEKISDKTVFMADGKSYTAVGIGSVRIQTSNEKFGVLKGVLHIPSLKKNLISLGVLDSRGYRYSCEGGVLQVAKGSLNILKGLKKGSLYVLQGNTVTL